MADQKQREGNRAPEADPNRSNTETQREGSQQQAQPRRDENTQATDPSKTGTSREKETGSR